MNTIVKPIPHTVDLNEPVKKTYIDTLLATEDNLAHRFDITLLQGGQAVAMPSGAAVTAYFIRYSDNATVPITNGAVNGNVATVTLTKACYNKPGQFAIIIKVSGGGIVNTMFYGEGTIFTSSTDTIIDEGNVIPSLADLLARIAEMESATAAANTATNRANAAANRCEQMQIDASGMAGDSNMLGGQSPEYYAKQETVNQLSQQKVDYADALTLEEIAASTSLDKKVASASALRNVYKSVCVDLNAITYTSQAEIYDYIMSQVPNGRTAFVVFNGANIKVLTAGRYDMAMFGFVNVQNVFLINYALFSIIQRSMYIARQNETKQVISSTELQGTAII